MSTLHSRSRSGASRHLRAGGIGSRTTLGWSLLAAASVWSLVAFGCGDDEGGAGSTAIGGIGGTPTGTTTTGTTTTGTSTGGTGGSGGTGATGGTGGTGATGGTGGTGGMPGCDTAPMTPVAEDAGMFQGAFVYIGQSTLGDPVDVLRFELYNGTPSVETLTITDDPYEFCMDCVLFSVGCDAFLNNCQQHFLAQSGEIDITSSGGSGQTFAGQLRNADFIEVTIANGSSTPVPNGDQFCWAPYDFSATIQ